ncbi:glyoxalase superfamily protein [Pseudomonas sp. NCCP-436]|uniref:glyoxalase superfamily protein n=1 Tax=Pseudomonas sp. NCCP-436 TaxID=2842481 RepID=UPI001C7E8D33|nr:glyoxalase superfamily protein [Pseudomonas sp. NCCP-436]GIZ13437.1 glyoxalase [Pseudomonas sp. NCCP-436]
MRLAAAIPVLRSFDEGCARAFYIDYLGFVEDWAHRFEPALPLYLQVSRGDCVLHLSEHHGDCCPGAALRIFCADLDALLAELTGRDYGFARPAIVSQPWGRDLTLTDPSGNRLIFTDTQ